MGIWQSQGNFVIWQHLGCDKNTANPSEADFDKDHSLTDS